MANYGHRRRVSSLLELEAAEFFKLDLGHMHLCSTINNKSAIDLRRYNSPSSASSSGSLSGRGALLFKPSKASATMQTQRDRTSIVRSNENVHQQQQQQHERSRTIRNKPSHQNPRQQTEFETHQKLNVHLQQATHNTRQQRQQKAMTHTMRHSKRNLPQSSHRHAPSSCYAHHATHELGACSSASSTNSLPSISSSPSVSPSLVCPHLSLDDILAFRQGPSGSPHTVGLCPRCRLDPPPNIHSPLSPHFRPHHHSQARRLDACDKQPPPMRRGHSDHQASCQEARRRRLTASGALPPIRQKSDLTRLRDDSLDFGLGPGELKRMQMSPSLRNSVEFIRRNSIESGRVIRIYKNGQPFEKPLRVCILRDEFSSLNHLLDHINSRLLVPNGARFLFHLDGQPVYSVHELKHGSVYIVSGKRQCDYRTSEVLKASQLKEQQTQANKMLLADGNHEQHGKKKSARKEPERTIGYIDSQRTQQAGKEMMVEVAGDRRKDVLSSGMNGTSQSRARVVGVRRPTEPKGAMQSVAGAKMVRKAGDSDSRESNRGMRELNKFSRYDDSTGLSSGGLNASSQSIVAASDEGPVRLTRAKSELSALPMRKPKKNVTFMDTGRGSSPAISDISSGQDTTTRASERVSSNGGPAGSNSKLQEKPQPISRDLSTSEIGIQVSDSIDGFLIDLPVALPAKGDDSNLARPRNATRAKNATNRANNGRAAGGKPMTSTSAKKTSERPRQIVTITERQLSLEEMQELQDLSAGDHHHEITIKWDTPPGDGTSGQESGTENQATVETELEVVPDRTNTIAIGTDPQPPVGQSARLITSVGGGTVSRQEEPNKMKEEEEEAANRWQYPGGRESSATPTERPVSQSGPSETVRARVTTPTPSLSTCGDNNSLAMSYETISQSGDRQQPYTGKVSQVERLRSTPSELPEKERVEVKGTLCSGLDKPARNFRLVWVNGFAINDLYPENTYNVAQEWAGSGDGRTSGRASGSSSPSARLTPGYNVGATSHHQLATGAQKPPPSPRQSDGTLPYKPSERFHNWICHSRKHDELLYPAGSLIVLWCRWTNEQRYYAKHTSNVSALTLATLDLDLAASAQVCDLNERPPIASNIHLWSLTSLNTLVVIQDEQFRLKLIFSLRLRNTKTSGCELSIAARDEKQLLLFEYNQKLPNAKGTLARDETMELRAQGDKQIVKGEKAANSSQQPVMMRATKALQSNQLPLFLLRVPNMSESQANKQLAQTSGEPIISFGRRHFNIWSSDPKQRKLRPMQSDQKSAKFVELIGRANCLCRLSPGEFLAGDSDGNVALLLINCLTGDPTLEAANSSSARVKQQRPVGRTPITGPDASSKYSLEVINLLGPSVARVNQSNNKNGGGTNHLAHTQATQAITCLTRVTGSLFMSADSSCTVRFWKIKRTPRRDERKNSVPTVRLASSSIMVESQQSISCEQLSSISLPPDLGFICTLIMAQYNLRESLVEFYVVSTSNTILFGSVKLPSQYTKPNRGNSTLPTPADHGPPARQVDLLANSSLSVVYEGHETSATSLVADVQLEQDAHTGQLSECQYFTCSLDCRICKWQGKQLVWKSLLPSSCASLAVHPTGFVLAVGSLDGTVYILDKMSGLLISYFPLTPVRINCLAYSSDGSLLAAACANGSIFMLPVYERGLKYKKVSIFQSPHPVVSLQFSMDNRYMLTSVTHGAYQELILWDLPNFRYMRDNVKLAADKISWFDSICSGSEDVRAIWENANLSSFPIGDSQLEGDTKRSSHKRPQPASMGAISTRRADTTAKRDSFVVNLSCHRLIKTDPGEANYVVASDTRGYLRLFRYPSYDIQQGFFAIRISSSAVNCCRFLHSSPNSNDYFVSTSLDGSICLWTIE